MALEVVAETQGFTAAAVPEPVNGVDEFTQTEVVPEIFGNALMVKAKEVAVVAPDFNRTL